MICVIVPAVLVAIQHGIRFGITTCTKRIDDYTCMATPSKNNAEHA